MSYMSTLVALAIGLNSMGRSVYCTLYARSLQFLFQQRQQVHEIVT